MKRGFAHTVASFFAFLCIVFIPFPFYLSKIQLSSTDFIFGKLIGIVSSNFFGKVLADTRVYSDYISMYILVLLLFILSMLISLLLPMFKKWSVYRQKVAGLLYMFFIYYLVLQLLKYGVDKIFKNQFYMPEPNILFTPLGKIDKDLLYWSSMGTSHFYNFFLGLLELLAAILILIKRTRLIGLLLSFGIMLNVVAVNFGFDISVKLFSLFLLFLTIYLLIPYWNRLYQLILLQRNGYSYPGQEKVVLINNKFVAAFLKWLAVGLILMEVFYPFIKAGNFNGDKLIRPYLHGAYDVKQMIIGTDTLDPEKLPLKRFFIHKDSYMIFQDQADEMKDYKLSYNSDHNKYVLTDYDLNQTEISFSYLATDSLLILKYFKAGKYYELTGKSVDWKKLPLLQKGFHWTVDGSE